MPGSPRRQSFELSNKIYGHNHEACITGLPPPSASPYLNTMAGNIKYIPGQQDPMAGISTMAARTSPLRLMLMDAGVLITMLRYLPNIFLPFKASHADDELSLSFMNVQNLALQGVLFVFETIILLLALPAILVLPGALWIAAWAACCTIVYLAVKPIEGPTVVYSNMSEETLRMAKQHKNERWLFVNGCAVGYAGLQDNVDRTAETFGRAVVGIHNRTYGLVADVIECLIQRNFFYRTQDVRVAHSYVKATLVDPTVDKVVLIGHSQGGLIVSLVLDQLFSELPSECMSKLEIYTFGSAASHFSNPLLSLPSLTNANHAPFSSTETQSDEVNQPNHVIPHIEHYANEKDMVPRWGVLHCTQDVLNNRYAGSVFVRLGASGHMYNQHYMDAMFPLSNKEQHRQQHDFLDRVIQVDKNMATRRESTALTSAHHLKKHSSLEFGDGEVIPDMDLAGSAHEGGSVASGAAMLTFARTNSGTLLAEEAQGKTVRELSRLWRYLDGNSPPTSETFATAFSTLGNEEQWMSEDVGKGNKMKRVDFVQLNGGDKKSVESSS